MEITPKSSWITINKAMPSGSGHYISQIIEIIQASLGPNESPYLLKDPEGIEHAFLPRDIAEVKTSLGMEKLFVAPELRPWIKEKCGDIRKQREADAQARRPDIEPLIPIKPRKPKPTTNPVADKPQNQR